MTSTRFRMIGVVLFVVALSDSPPATQDGAFYVTLSDVFQDDVTNKWTMQLHCGQFVDLGQPPVDVAWTMPTGEVRKSTYQENGTFVLSVSNPVHLGKYSCQLPPSAPAARCLTATSPLHTAAELWVDRNDVIKSLCDRRQREQEQANLPQHNDNYCNNSRTTEGPDNTTSCMDLLEGDPESGIRTVYVSGKPITVYCDQTTDNGGWIVFQRRQDDSLDFDQDWAEYRSGFGDLEKNFWLGLDKLHKLTTSQRYELRVDVHQWNGTKGHATYSGFKVDNVSHNFALHFDDFTGGNAGDSLSYHRGHQFTARDRDNDVRPTGNCAHQYHGAWWFRWCHESNLNGCYKSSSWAPNHQGVSWTTFGGYKYSMKFAEMKIRPI